MTGFIHRPAKVQPGRFLASFVLLVFVAWLAACGPVIERTSKPDYVSFVSQQVQDNGLIKAGDTLVITVKGEDDISGSYAVDNAGYVDLPLVGKFQLSNIDTMSAAKLVTDAYADGYLVSPDVRVEKKAVDAVFVMGAVRIPGSYAWCGDMTVMKAASLAGGFQTDADFSRFDVVRHGHAIQSNARTLAQPGDVIIVKSGEKP
jgi:polysaccharide export outer membrane protein